MNKIILTLISIITINVLYSQTVTSSLNISVVCLGKRNAEFNEKQFGNLNFYYTPKLNLTQDSATNEFVVTGKPKILEEWWAKQDLQHHAILFDSNGNGAWEGKLISNSSILKNIGFNETTFEEALKKYVKNNETITETKREFIIYSSNSVYRGKYYQYPFAERKITPFYIYDKASNAFLINELINNEKPFLLVFFYLDNFKAFSGDYPSNKTQNSTDKIINHNTIKLFNELNQIISKYNEY